MSDIAIEAVRLVRDPDTDEYERGVTEQVSRLIGSHHKDQEMWELWERGEEIAAAYEWRTDAMSSLILTASDTSNGNGNGIETPAVDDLTPDAATLPAQQETFVAREDAIKAVQAAAPAMLLHWDIQGSALMLYADGVIHVMSESGQLTQPKRPGELWRYQIGHERYRDVPDGSIIMRAWIPSPVSPWLAIPNARVKTIARAIHLLTTSIEATANSRTQLRDIILVKGQPRVTRVTRDGAKTTPGVGMEGLRAALTADISSTGKAVDAANVVVELLSTDDSIETLSLAGTFDSRAIAMRTALVQALARAMPVPTQVTLGTENSNDWSANAADRTAREVYLSAEARRVAQVACYLAGRVASDCAIEWRFDGLGELDQLSHELGLDLSAEASRSDIMLHVLLIGMTRNMDIETATAWANQIADLWQTRQAD